MDQVVLIDIHSEDPRFGDVVSSEVCQRTVQDGVPSCIRPSPPSAWHVVTL